MTSTTVYDFRNTNGNRVASLTLILDTENKTLDANYCDFDARVYNVSMRWFINQPERIADGINWLTRPEKPLKPENIRFDRGFIELNDWRVGYRPAPCLADILAGRANA